MRCVFAISLSALMLPTLRAGDEPKVDPAVKALVQRLKSGEGKAAVLLVKYGNAAVPGLVEALAESDPLIQGHAAHALGRIAPKNNKEALAALRKALGHQEKEVAAEAARALGKIGEPAVPVLIAALKEDKGPAPAKAAAALRLIGPPGAKAVPALADALKAARDRPLIER